MLPTLEVSGEILTDADAVHAALESHFAVPENGTKCLAKELMAKAAQNDAAKQLPTMPAMAAGFLALKCGRAPGASRIPAEAYRCAAVEAAIVYYSLCLECCKEFFSTPLVLYPLLSEISGWRHIALLEASEGDW